MSPSAAAPSSASATAWANTSASLWPSKPTSCGIWTPPMMHLRPSANRCTSIPIPTRFIGVVRITSLSLVKQCLCNGQISRRGDLQIEESCLDQMNFPAKQFNRRRFIGDDSLPLEYLRVRLSQQRKAYRLGRLYRPQLGAVHSANHRLIFAGLLDCIHHFAGGNPGAVRLRAGDGGFNQCRRDQRTRPIVNRHDVRHGITLLQTIPDRILAFDTAIGKGDDLLEAKLANDLFRLLCAIGTAH